MGLLLVLNLRGKINSTDGVRKALGELKVERRFSATVVTDDGPTRRHAEVVQGLRGVGARRPEAPDQPAEGEGMVSESRKLDQERPEVAWLQEVRGSR